MASPSTVLPADLSFAKSRTRRTSPVADSPAAVEKIQPEHAMRADPLGALLTVKISDVNIPAAEFFVSVTSISSNDFANNGPILAPSIDYSHDPDPAFGMGADMRIHQRSQFFDHLTASREEYVEKMQTYHLYAALRNPAHSYSPDFNQAVEVRNRRSLSLESAEQVRVHIDDSGFARDPSTVDLPWSFNTAQSHILNVIKANTVPKAKKKKKRDKLPTPTPDILTLEEASLNYQTVVLEEKLRQELQAFELVAKKCSMNKERLTEIRKRYDQEVHACKSEFNDNEAELKILENEWSLKIQEAEAAIAETQMETADITDVMKAKIVKEERTIALLQKEIAVWIRFREGPMLRNKARITQLTKAIADQDKNRADYIRLTEEAVHLAEENAKSGETKALNDLCQRHITEVCESLPSEEIQEIENNDILSAELVTLTNIFTDLTEHTETLQRKIIHQVATAQIMLESVNQNNARLVQTQLFNMYWHRDKHSMIHKLEELKVTGNEMFSTNYMYHNFHKLNKVQAMTGGLTVTGTAVLIVKVPPARLGTGQGMQVKSRSLAGGGGGSGQGSSTSDLQPGFLLKVPSVNKDSVGRLNCLAERDSEFGGHLIGTVLDSEQLSHFSLEDDDGSVEVQVESATNKDDASERGSANKLTSDSCLIMAV